MAEVSARDGYRPDFQTLDRELEPATLDVEGEFPPWLAGSRAVFPGVAPASGGAASAS